MGTIIFIVAALVTLYAAGSMLYQLLRRQRSTVRRTGLLFGLLAGGYMAALVLVSVTSTSSTLPLNQKKCFDEWCAAVVSVDKIAAANSSQDYRVTLQISNTGRGRAQRPDHPHVYVVDANNHSYDESQAAQADYESRAGSQAPIGQLIQAGSTFTTTRVFRLPEGAKAYLVITEGGWPTYLTIGDEGSWLHKESLTPLE